MVINEAGDYETLEAEGSTTSDCTAPRDEHGCSNTHRVEAAAERVRGDAPSPTSDLFSQRRRANLKCRTGCLDRASVACMMSDFCVADCP